MDEMQTKQVFFLYSHDRPQGEKPTNFRFTFFDFDKCKLFEKDMVNSFSELWFLVAIVLWTELVIESKYF